MLMKYGILIMRPYLFLEVGLMITVTVYKLRSHDQYHDLYDIIIYSYVIKLVIGYIEWNFHFMKNTFHLMFSVEMTALSQESHSSLNSECIFLPTEIFLFTQ